MKYEVWNKAIKSNVGSELFWSAPSWHNRTCPNADNRNRANTLRSWRSYSAIHKILQLHASCTMVQLHASCTMVEVDSIARCMPAAQWRMGNSSTQLQLQNLPWPYHIQRPYVGGFLMFDPINGETHCHVLWVCTFFHHPMLQWCTYPSWHSPGCPSASQWQQSFWLSQPVVAILIIVPWDMP